jgi:hypothetical protein
VIDWQKLACALATRGAFSIVTGGPGTGKTTTVVRLLALLQAPAVEAGKPLRIRLAAPTGKAAARLTESISQQVRTLKVDAIRQKIPSDVTTVHRLLGSRPGTRHFRHHAGNRLPLDVLVVDEASMIDLEMMANLLDALPPMRAWCCWATRISWPRWRPVPCWAICAAMPRPAGTARKHASGWKQSVAKAWRPVACRKTPMARIRWPSKW